MTTNTGSTSPSIWVWNWTWNCADGSSQGAAPDPASLAAGTWVWNWTWNCSGTDPPAAECTGCNTAISIRILSPGDDGALTQAVNVSSTSIAANVSSSVQGAIQQVASALPSLPLPDPAPTGPVPSSAVPSSMAPGVLAVSPVTGIGALLEPLGIALDLESEALLFDSQTLSGASRRAQDRMQLDRRSVVVTAMPQTVAATLAPAAVPVVAAAPSSGGAAGAAGTSHAPSKPRAPLRAPAPPAPFGFASDLSTGAGAHGSSSSLSGFALLLGVLFVSAPGLARWLRVEVETLPRTPRSRRLERPG